jgi:hypothetical protein
MSEIQTISTLIQTTEPYPIIKERENSPIKIQAIPTVIDLQGKQFFKMVLLAFKMNN